MKNVTLVFIGNIAVACAVQLTLEGFSVVFHHN